ncbi:MAG: hypothetical protein R3E66_03060 [bacterium]
MSLVFGCGDDSPSDPPPILMTPDVGMESDASESDANMAEDAGFDADPETAYVVSITPRQIGLKVGAQVKVNAVVTADGVEIDAGQATLGKPQTQPSRPWMIKVLCVVLQPARRNCLL